MEPYKILIAGIGAVGGYFGGLLAHANENSDEIQVHFLARGENLEQIRRDGLKVFTGDQMMMARPASASDRASDFGVVDLILICTKSYDLETMLATLRPCIDADTILLPLLNGVDSVERILALYPDNKVWQGFAYLIARRTEPGVIHNTGNIQKLFFGNDGNVTPQMQFLDELMLKAGIESVCTTEITRMMWEKFIFISPLASVTSYLDLNRGQIMDDSTHMALLDSMIAEVILLARTLGVDLIPHIHAVTLQKLRILSKEATSSMHHDFSHGKRTELETLTGYVVRKAKEVGTSAPGYSKVYANLSARVHG